MRSTIDYKKVGAQIQTARINAGKTQKAVAAVCGCEAKHISAVENGRTRPSLELLARFSREYEVPVDYFLQGLERSPLIYEIEEECKRRVMRMDYHTQTAALSMLDTLIRLQEAERETLKEKSIKKRKITR